MSKTKLMMIVVMLMVNIGYGKTDLAYNFDSWYHNDEDGKDYFADISDNGHPCKSNTVLGTHVQSKNINPFNQDKSINQSVGFVKRWATVYPQNMETLSFPKTDQFTVEAWVLPGNEQCFTKITMGPQQILVGLSRYGKPTVKLHDSIRETTVSARKKVSLNKWIHIAASYNGKDLKLYVNGRFQGRASRAGVDILVPTMIQIGTGTNQLYGCVDDYRISDTALVPSKLGYHKSMSIL